MTFGCACNTLLFTELTQFHLGVVSAQPKPQVNDILGFTNACGGDELACGGVNIRRMVWHDRHAPVIMPVANRSRSYTGVAAACRAFSSLLRTRTADRPMPHLRISLCGLVPGKQHTETSLPD
jgi:hypothetical protein